MILAAITTCRREPAMLDRAIKSVIAQTFADWNLVVVDDSPADWPPCGDVRKMVEGYAQKDSRIRYIAHDKNYGANKARNTALNIALGSAEFIAYLDDDDEWLPEKLEKQYAKFQECGDDVALVGCGGIESNEIGNYTLTIMPGRTENTKLFQLAIMCGPTSSPLIRTKCLADIGGFDEKITAHQEWEMLIRIVMNYKVEFVNEVLYVYHVHKGERINSNPGRYIAAKEYIINKNLTYLEHDKEEYRLQLESLFKLCAGMSLSVWAKMVRVKPSLILKDLCLLARLLVPLPNFKRLLMVKCPRIYGMLKAVKGRLRKYLR